MGFLSRFEGKVEDTFEGAADKMFDAPISPVQIAKKAEKKMRREKMVGAGKQYAPTLYTVLVNADDDERLFGYYPTLAGETETYLAAKAADEGLVMDGQPLVRFIVDEDLKHGKFDVIAEPVAAPIIEQLRAEEMERYGLAPQPARRPSAPFGAAAGRNPYAAAPAAQPYAAPVPAAQQPYAAPAPAAQPDPYAPAGGAAYPNDPNDPYAPGTYNDADGYDAYDQAAPAGEKPPLPYVPEDEIDYSIDYGEYTFDSQDFEDYSEHGSVGTPLPSNNLDELPGERIVVGGNRRAAEAAPIPNAVPGQMGAPAPQPMPAPQAQPIPNAAAGAAAAAAGAAAVGAAYGTPDTVMFAAGAGAATPVPNQNAVQARLIDTTNNRTYALATARLLIGRESSCDIVLPDINASRAHAELRYEPQGMWVLSDLGSTNGTLINGYEISTAPLHEGDRITIGMTNLVFTLS